MEGGDARQGEEGAPSSGAAGTEEAAILQLPVEVVVCIANWLPLRDIGRMSLACRALHSLLAHDSIWHHAAERELGAPHSLGLPEHYRSWLSLCAHLNQFRRELPRPSVIEETASLVGWRPFAPVGTAVTTLTLWLFMADIREGDNQSTMPIVYVQNGETQLCIGMPWRAPNLMIAYKQAPDNTPPSEEEEQTIGRLFQRRRRSAGGWVCDFESANAFPLLEWTHVTIEIEWQAPPASSSNAPEDITARPSLKLWFGSEDIGTTISAAANRRPWEFIWRQPYDVQIGHLETACRRSLVREVRVYDTKLHPGDTAFLSAIVPPPPHNLSALNAQVQTELQSGDQHPLQGLRYNCVEGCDFDLCQKCYDAGINPAHLPVSPDHEKDHGFRVLQTRGFGAQGYLVPPPTPREDK